MSIYPGRCPGLKRLKPFQGIQEQSLLYNKPVISRFARGGQRGELNSYFSQGELVGVLDLAEDEEGVEGADAVEVAKDAEHELLVGLHVGDVDLEHEVVVAADVVALHNLGYVLHGLHDAMGVLVAVLLHAEVAEGDEAAVDLLCVEHRHVLTDVALALEALHPLEGGCGREVNLCGQLLVGQPRIVLQEAQDLQVSLVELGHVKRIKN